MTTPKRSVAPEADDLSGVPFIDDAERDESAWLLARDADPRAPAPSLTIAIKTTTLRSFHRSFLAMSSRIGCHVCCCL